MCFTYCSGSVILASELPSCISAVAMFTVIVMVVIVSPFWFGLLSFLIILYTNHTTLTSDYMGCRIKGLLVFCLQYRQYLDIHIYMVYNLFIMYKTDESELSQQFNLKIDPRTLDMLRSLSALADRSMSATIRHLIRQEYDLRQTTDKPLYSYDGDAPGTIPVVYGPFSGQSE